MVCMLTWPPLKDYLPGHINRWYTAATGSKLTMVKEEKLEGLAWYKWRRSDGKVLGKICTRKSRLYMHCKQAFESVLA